MPEGQGFQKPEFDSNKTYVLPMIDGRKITVNFPSDEQWERYRKGQKILYRTLGRGSSQRTTERVAGVDSKILEEILADGEMFSEAEASQVLDRLDQAEILRADKQNAVYEIAMRVPGAVVEHALRIPTQEQVASHRRSGGSVIDRPHNLREVRIGFGDTEQLFASLVKETKGYASGSRIPINHKLAALEAMLEELGRELEDDAGDADF